MWGEARAGKSCGAAKGGADEGLVVEGELGAVAGKGREGGLCGSRPSECSPSSPSTSPLACSYLDSIKTHLP